MCGRSPTIAHEARIGKASRRGWVERPMDVANSLCGRWTISLRPWKSNKSRHMSLIGRHPAKTTSIEQAMNELRHFPRAQWLDLARTDQATRWRQDLGVLVEEYFLHVPEL